MYQKKIKVIDKEAGLVFNVETSTGHDTVDTDISLFDAYGQKLGIDLYYDATKKGTSRKKALRKIDKVIACLLDTSDSFLKACDEIDAKVKSRKAE